MTKNFSDFNNSSIRSHKIPNIKLETVLSSFFRRTCEKKTIWKERDKKNVSRTKTCFQKLYWIDGKTLNFFPPMRPKLLSASETAFYLCWEVFSRKTFLWITQIVFWLLPSLSENISNFNNGSTRRQKNISKKLKLFTHLFIWKVCWEKIFGKRMT